VYSGLVFIHIFEDMDTTAGLSHKEKFAFAHRTEQNCRRFDISIHLGHQDTPVCREQGREGHGSATPVGFFKVMFCRIELGIDLYRFENTVEIGGGFYRKSLVTKPSAKHHRMAVNHQSRTGFNSRSDPVFPEIPVKIGLKRIDIDKIDPGKINFITLFLSDDSYKTPVVVKEKFAVLIEPVGTFLTGEIDQHFCLFNLFAEEHHAAAGNILMRRFGEADRIRLAVADDHKLP